MLTYSYTVKPLTHRLISCPCVHQPWDSPQGWILKPGLSLARESQRLPPCCRALPCLPPAVCMQLCGAVTDPFITRRPLPRASGHLQCISPREPAASAVGIPGAERWGQGDKCNLVHAGRLLVSSVSSSLEPLIKWLFTSQSAKLF